MYESLTRSIREKEEREKFIDIKKKKVTNFHNLRYQKDNKEIEYTALCQYI